jgi:hypothetical protein
MDASASMAPAAAEVADTADLGDPAPGAWMPRLCCAYKMTFREGASMTNDPELHPLMSLRLCAALWLGSIARHELIEKPCRAFLSRFTSLRSPDFARASW